MHIVVLTAINHAQKQRIFRMLASVNFRVSKSTFLPAVKRSFLNRMQVTYALSGGVCIPRCILLGDVSGFAACPLGSYLVFGVMSKNGQLAAVFYLGTWRFGGFSIGFRTKPAPNPGQQSLGPDIISRKQPKLLIDVWRLQDRSPAWTARVRKSPGRLSFQHQ